MAPPRRRWKWLLLAVVPLALLLAVPTAWAIDNAVHDGQVVRNVSLEGRAIGGLAEGDLRLLVEGIADDYRLVEVQLRADDGVVIPLTAERAGLVVDVDATVGAAMAIGRAGGLTDRFRSWAESLTDDHRAGIVYAIDADRARATIAGHPLAIREEPTEPTFRTVNGKLTPIPGTVGAQLDPDPIVAALLPAAQTGDLPIAVDFTWVPLQPAFSSSDLASALARAQDLVSRPIAVSINGHQTVIAPETVRRWVEADENLDVYFDEERVMASLRVHLADLTAGGGEPTFTVVDGVLQVGLADPVLVCCEGPVADLMLGTARGLLPKPAPLTSVVEDPDGPVKQVEKIGIVELVGEFTTNHSCCQSRVENIHRIADLIRGQIIEPGGRFSVNEFIGRRTREKGFVAAGVIEQGRFTQDVGGGISQFATTMFNAAFFAGLDFEEYQSHSIYISRYPYGREATLSFPKPDLVVTNPTPWHMLIWTSYTDTSITVSIYSTRHFVVEQTDQARYAVGYCTRADTFRTRTDPSGMVLNDFVFALYRPGEGRACNNRPTPRN